MQIISPEVGLIQKILGKQTIKNDCEYRMLTFCQTLETEDGTLVYNVLTKEMILLDKEEEVCLQDFENCPKELSDILIEKWFFVPVESDDRKLFKQLKNMAKIVDNKKKVNSYTIVTTTDCNARCFYCYELGVKRIPMSEQTARDVALYMKDNSVDNRVKITWFGGEPLYNTKAIDVICDTLKELNVEYNSVMISNGYLFDDELIQKAKEEWKLLHVQITLDGTEEVYNRSKAYIHKEGSAFIRVMNNIEKLLSHEIKVSIRLNMDMHNAEDLFNLCDYLEERLKKYRGFRVYTALLYEDEGERRTEERRKALYQKYFELEDYIEAKGLSGHPMLKNEFKLNRCMADSNNASVITPVGKLSKCEHFTESELWGDIYSDDRDEDVLASWREYLPEVEACAECKFYPECMKVKKCPNSVAECVPEERIKKERTTKMAMKYTYKAYKNKNKKKNI